MDLGFYGRDSPAALVDHVTKTMNSTVPDLDAILVNGDMVAHGYALDNSSSPNKNETWQEIKQIIAQTLGTLRSNSKADILPSIGNNDVVVHY